jgi:L-2-hydroxyglutarate oxidase
MVNNSYDVIIIGGGIVGLATAMALSNTQPEKRILVLEKEATLAFHQTGHNSGVIHSGIYYKPGSLKAELCRQGNVALVEFCQKYHVPYEICGKVIVATEPEELPLLENLYQRGIANGLGVHKLNGKQVQEIEPYVTCLAGISVASTGIIDYKKLCQKYAELIVAQGGEVRLNTKVEHLLEKDGGYVVVTTQGDFTTKYLVNCGGLQSDRVAKLGNVDPQAKIVPFRGEYYELTPEKRYLVKHLIYPVPNPNFPFLGVHFTRMIDGNIHAGPNAVLSLKREGYRKTEIDLRDVIDTFSYPGFWKLATKYVDIGMQEIIRSFSKAAFVKSLQRLIPDVEADDLIPLPPGIRAQALGKDGSLIDDFLLVKGKNALHVCNAPSPAATASLSIGCAIVKEMDFS